MAHPLVVAHPPVAQAQNWPRGSGIPHAGGLDDGHRGPTVTTTLDAIFRGVSQRTTECAPTPPGAPRQGRPVQHPPRHWQPGSIDCEEEE
jgi:hypothetical protein